MRTIEQWRSELKSYVGTFGMSKECAEYLGVSAPTLSKLVTGKTNPSARMAEKIEDKAGIRIPEEKLIDAPERGSRTTTTEKVFVPIQKTEKKTDGLSMDQLKELLRFNALDLIKLEDALEYFCYRDDEVYELSPIQRELLRVTFGIKVGE